jgi:hypothetical protein
MSVPTAAGTSVNGIFTNGGTLGVRISGWTVRIVAIAASSDCPGFSRSMMNSIKDLRLVDRRVLAANQRLSADRQRDVERLSDFETEELGRRHADERERHTFNGKGGADDTGGSAEPPRPRPAS